MHLEYGRAPVIYRVSQAEHVIHIRVAASQEYVNTDSTWRSVSVFYLWYLLNCDIVDRFPSSVVKCLWGLFVWGLGCCSCRVCVCVCRCRGCCSLSVCVCV